MQPKMQASTAANYLNVSLQAIHKNIRKNNLETFKGQNKVFFYHPTSRKIFDHKIKPKCFTWQNLKGGVGKTNLSFSAAVRLVSYGLRVAVIDLDQQGNFTQACQVDASEKPILFDIISQNLNIKDCFINVIDGLDILPSRIENALLDNLFAINGLPVDRELKKRISPLLDEYDIIFIDCPPSLGSSVCAASLSADYIIVPTDPEMFSISGLKITLSEIEKNVADRYDVKIPVKIILNKFDARTALSHEVLSTLYSDPNYKDKLFKSFIRTNQQFPNCISKGVSLFDTMKPCTAKEDIDLLTREIIDLCKP